MSDRTINEPAVGVTEISASGKPSSPVAIVIVLPLMAVILKERPFKTPAAGSVPIRTMLSPAVNPAVDSILIVRLSVSEE